MKLSLITLTKILTQRQKIGRVWIWIKQAFKNRVAGTFVTSAVAEDFSAGITEAVTETAANILEIGEQVTKPVVAGAVPNLPAGDGKTTNPLNG
jgi:hypothetical protein